MKSFFIALLALVPCRSFAQGVSVKKLDSVTISANNDPLKIYRATAERTWNIVHTDVTLEFDWAKREATGKAAITLEPIGQPRDSIVLDAKDMEILGVGWDMGLKKPANSTIIYDRHGFRYDGRQLHISMPGDVRAQSKPGTRCSIYIHYIARPYAAKAGGSSAITGDRGLYFINTDGKIPGKHQEIWTQGETESNSHWLPTIDKPNERFTVKVALANIADTLTTLSNGKLVSAVKGTKPHTKTWTWEMDKPIQTYAIMFAIGRYDIVKDLWRGKEVSYYVEPEFKPYAHGMFSNSTRMLEYFSQVTGVPYPWNKYSQITARDYVSGAMENTTASLFGEFMNKDFRELYDDNNESVVAHEMFHQWFGDYVTAESWSNLTLNESFATLGTQLWYEHAYSEDMAEAQAYRDLRSYLESTQQNDPPLVRYSYRDKEDMFDRVSYQKGSCILRYARYLAGKDAFSEAMRIYLTDNALQPAEASDWRKALETATGKDWSQFFDQWYYRGGHPNLTIRYRFDDSAQQCRVTIRQKTTPDTSYFYTLKMPARVGYDGVPVADTEWTIAGAKTVIVLPYRNGLPPIVFPDPHRVIPCSFDEPNKTLFQYQMQAMGNNNFRSWQRALDAAFSRMNSDTSISIFQVAITSESEPVVEYAMDLVVRAGAKSWRAPLTPMVKGLLYDGNHSAPVRANALKTLGQWQADGWRDLPAAYLNDSSYTVAGNALRLLEETDKDQAYYKAKSFIAKGARGDLRDQAFIVVASAARPEDTAFFRREMANVYGRYRSGLARNVYLFGSKVKDDRALELTLTMLADEAQRPENADLRDDYSGSVIYLARQLAKSKTTDGARRAKIARRFAEELIKTEPDADTRRELEKILNEKDKNKDGKSSEEE